MTLYCGKEVDPTTFCLFLSKFYYEYFFGVLFDAELPNQIRIGFKMRNTYFLLKLPTDFSALKYSSQTAIDICTRLRFSNIVLVTKLTSVTRSQNCIVLRMFRSSVLRKFQRQVLNLFSHFWVVFHSFVARLRGRLAQITWSIAQSWVQWLF